ncbi:MAG: ribosome small subunit-dependent GTPase A [Arthrobacter sp.]|nr:ribosome small subunit-dependent GTPase A [Arthrobacter sp.]
MATPPLTSASSPASSRLDALGWGPDIAAAFTAAHPSPGAEPARVLRAERGSCEVMTASGPVRVDLIASHHREPEDTPTTGDWVVLAPPPGTVGDVAEPRRLEALLPRRTSLRRGGASAASHLQLLAANVDTVIVAVSLANPLRQARTERLLALAWASGATPVVALTKADLSLDTAGAQAAVSEVALGTDVVLTSAATGEGIERLRALARGTVALLGPSGAGKSSLGNALLGEELLDTGAIREADGRGRHTTAWRELLPLPGGGVLLDTPGLRSVGMTGDEEGLERAFEDIEALSAGCRFADCEHRTEPGCSVLAAIEDGRLTRRRLESYRKLLRENAWQASRSDARLRQELGAKWKSVAKSHRAMKQELKRRNNGR